MKKLISFAMLIALCLIMLLAATSCSVIDKVKEKISPDDSIPDNEKMPEEDGDSYVFDENADRTLEEYYINMLKEKSYRIDMISPDPATGKDTTLIIQYDHGLTYIKAPYSGTKINEGYMYKHNMYQKVNGKWEISTSHDYYGVADMIDYTSIDKLFSTKLYDRVDGDKVTYRAKESEIFGFRNVVCTIDSGVCTFEIDAMDGSVRGQIVISKVGEVELAMPAFPSN